MSAHERERLSEYLDGALGADDRDAVRAHLSSCAECAQELERLRGIGSLLKTLPQEPLPTGFLQRLEYRRARTEAPGKAWAPPPARMAALAIGSLMAVFVLGDQARQIMGESQGLISGAATDLPSAAISAADLDQARAAKPARELARAKGAPIGASELETFRAGAGRVTNEMLQADLERQKKEMGIRGIAAKRGSDPAAEALAQAADAAANAAVVHLRGSGAPRSLRAEDDAVQAKAAPQLGAPAAAEAPAAVPAATTAEGLVIETDEDRRATWERLGLRLNPPAVNWNRNRIALVLAPDTRHAVEIAAIRTGAERVTIHYRLFPRSDSPDESEGKPAVRAYQFRVFPKSEKPVVFERYE